MARRKRKTRAETAGSAAFPHHYGRPGAPPGSVDSVDWDPADGPAPVLTVVDFDPERIDEQSGADLASCKRSLEDPSVTWVHVQGHVSPRNLERLGAQFALHPLALEDVLHLGQRPKLDSFEPWADRAIAEPSTDTPTAPTAPDQGRELFVILAVPRFVEDRLEIRQASLFLGKNWVISFFEGEEDVFGAVRQRVRATASRFRARGADYVFYALVDLIIDLGFPVLEEIGERIDALEVSLTADANQATLQAIHLLKREQVLLRRFLWPQREIAAALLRDEHEFFAPETRIYLRDCYDHAVQLLDLVETYREMTGNLLDVYLSSVSNRLNEAMRFLTVISTIFIPLSFFVGVYGMNFEWMPELKWRWGYPMTWGVIVATAGGMLLFFRHRRWL